MCGYKEIDRSIIDNTSKKNLTLKDFSTSNPQRFDRGNYIISFEPNNNELQCIAKKILTLANYCKQPIYVCWYHKNHQNGIYRQLSTHYAIETKQSIQIPSYANEGFLDAMTTADNNELYMSYDKNNLNKETISTMPVFKKNFSKSNIKNYNKGHYYVHEADGNLICKSDPDIMHIHNSSETIIYYARYTKEKLKTVAHDHVFYKLEDPLPFATAYAEIKKGETLTLAQLNKDEVLCLSTNIDDLKIGNIQNKKSNPIFIEKSHTIRPTYLITQVEGKIEVTTSRESK